MIKIKLLIKIINVVKLVWASKSLAEKIIDTKKDFSESEVNKKSLALGRWELFKQTYYEHLYQVGLFDNDVESILKNKVLMELRKENCKTCIDISGDEMLELYSGMMEICKEAMTSGKKINEILNKTGE